MSTNSTTSSFLIACGTAANAKKLAEWLNGITNYPADLKEKMRAANEDIFDEDGVVQYTITDASLEDGDPTTVWVYFDDGDMQVTVAILEYAMATMPEMLSPQGFEWADTCSRPRIGEFGGGAVALWRGKDTQWMNTSYWLSQVLSSEGESE